MKKTLIIALIVLAVLACIGAAVFVAMNPDLLQDLNPHALRGVIEVSKGMC